MESKLLRVFKMESSFEKDVKSKRLKTMFCLIPLTISEFIANKNGFIENTINFLQLSLCLNVMGLWSITYIVVFCCCFFLFCFCCYFDLFVCLSVCVAVFLLLFCCCCWWWWWCLFIVVVVVVCLFVCLFVCCFLFCFVFVCFLLYYCFF